MSEIEPTTLNCIDRVRSILRSARDYSLQTVNAAMISAYWEVGQEIAEEEQRGEQRSRYGDYLIKQLSEKLTADFGRGFSVATLKAIRQFYLTYRDRVPPIGYTPSSQSPSDSYSPDHTTLSDQLSWSHYSALMRIVNPEIREFYERECIASKWSVRELNRQIASLLFERLAKSRDKEGVLALSRDGHVVHKPEDLIKDPYVLEFTGLPETSRWLESDLEQALIERLQRFLLELGRDLFFVARQKRITIDGDHFYIDLVFYHRMLRCFLLIDLKVGKLTQGDIGQMLLYTGYYETNESHEGENPPIGLILCTDKNEAAVKYTLSQTASQVFTSRYQLHLPTEQELAEEIRRERELLEQTKES